ncbi:hypothetical protein BC827DRAFT_416166 [Russula dissimulans]|nr:hypothetical protein BC827DRAFT_416166 [Russula dissimulans]
MRLSLHSTTTLFLLNVLVVLSLLPRPVASLPIMAFKLGAGRNTHISTPSHMNDQEHFDTVLTFGERRLPNRFTLSLLNGFPTKHGFAHCLGPGCGSSTGRPFLDGSPGSIGWPSHQAPRSNESSHSASTLTIRRRPSSPPSVSMTPSGAAPIPKLTEEASPARSPLPIMALRLKLDLRGHEFRSGAPQKPEAVQATC